MKISIVGTTGSGKSTLGKELAAKYACKFIELDELNFKANWEPIPRDEFIQKTKKELNADSWVCVGNYSIVRNMIWEDCTHIIWLNYPLGFSFVRLVKRSIKRVYTGEKMYNGNEETFSRTFLSKNSILVWFFKTYWKRKKNYPKLLKDYTHKEIIVLKNHKQTKAFLSLHPFNGKIQS